MSKQKKYLHAKIATSATSYEKLLKAELSKLEHKLKFTFHEYWKQMPSELQKIYEWTSEDMRNDGSLMLVIRNSDKKICAHLLIDKEYYRTSYKASQREDLDFMLESIRNNFIIHMENYIGKKEQDNQAKR